MCLERDGPPRFRWGGIQRAPLLTLLAVEFSKPDGNRGRATYEPPEAADLATYYRCLSLRLAEEFAITGDGWLLLTTVALQIAGEVDARARSSASATIRPLCDFGRIATETVGWSPSRIDLRSGPAGWC